MAFFKFRKGADDLPSAPVQAQSIEVMRRRAKHRLIGSALLVLVGVIGFPLVFDNQPRPVAVDIPIQIPDRNKVKPLTIPAPVVAVRPVAEPVASTPSAALPASTAAARVTIAPTTALAGSAAVASAPAPGKVASTPPAAARPDPAAGADKASSAAMATTAGVSAQVPNAPMADDGAKAQALLEGKEASLAPASAEARFIVQVGAFADDSRAREVRLKLERAGFKTYVHVAETKEGRRTRVRVGPFGDKAAAQQAAEKIRTLELPAAVLSL